MTTSLLEFVKSFEFDLSLNFWGENHLNCEKRWPMIDLIDLDLNERFKK